VSVYSNTIVFIALPRQGFFLSRQQIADYLALWRWVGYVLGAPVDWMGTPESAKAMMESIIASEINPSPNSRILANNILTAEAGAPPFRSPREYLAAQAYLLNGDELAAELGIEKPPLRFRLLSWFQCLVLMCLCYSYPLMPAWVKQRRVEVCPEAPNHKCRDELTGTSDSEPLCAPSSPARSLEGSASPVGLSCNTCPSTASRQSWGWYATLG
jgi:hypothetical protein